MEEVSDNSVLRIACSSGAWHCPWYKVVVTMIMSNAVYNITVQFYIKNVLCYHMGWWNRSYCYFPRRSYYVNVLDCTMIRKNWDKLLEGSNGPSGDKKRCYLKSIENLEWRQRIGWSLLTVDAAHWLVLSTFFFSFLMMRYPRGIWPHKANSLVGVR